MGGAKGDAIAGAVLLALAVGYTVEALRLPGVKYAVGPGPSFLPVLLGVVLAALSLALVVAAARRAAEPSSAEWLASWRVAAILLTLLGYTLAFDWLGYLPSTALFLAVLLVLERQRWLVVVSVPLVTAALSYLLFVRWLGIPFPRGLLGL